MPAAESAQLYHGREKPDDEKQGKRERVIPEDLPEIVMRLIHRVVYRESPPALVRLKQ